MAIERTTKEELKKKMESGAPLTVIDVRNPVDYGKSKVKIKGAVRMSLDDVERLPPFTKGGKGGLTRCAGFDPKIEAVAYCT
ncbi:MAG: rhodanese-like domain-containing protein [Thermodesulfobacteriota bacterium]